MEGCYGSNCANLGDVHSKHFYHLQAKQEHGGFLHASPMELGDDDLE